MASKIKLGIYRHYKGSVYKVLGVGRNSENPKEELVVYQALYDSKEFGRNPIWVRPVNMFFENIKIDGKSVPRFTYLGSEK